MVVDTTLAQSVTGLTKVVAASVATGLAEGVTTSLAKGVGTSGSWETSGTSGAARASSASAALLLV